MQAIRDRSHYRLEKLSEARVTREYVGWLNDPEVNQFLEVRFTRQTDDSVRDFVRSFDGPVEKYAWAICCSEPENAFVGTCTLYDVNRRHQSAHFGIMIGDRAHWGTGCSSDAIRTLLDHAFDALGLRRVTGNCYASNRGMVFTFKRLGFVLEGTMRRAYCAGPDRFVDGYLWGMLAEEWHVHRGDRAD